MDVEVCIFAVGLHHPRRWRSIGEPSADMRRLLAEMMGLQEHQVMQMTKPAFGDVRAPRQWNENGRSCVDPRGQAVEARARWLHLHVSQTGSGW